MDEKVIHLIAVTRQLLQNIYEFDKPTDLEYLDAVEEAIAAIVKQENTNG